MAEFLLEALLADALLLEEWGSNAEDLPSSFPHTFSPLACRATENSSSAEAPCSPSASTISSASTANSMREADSASSSTTASSLGDDEITAAAILELQRRRNRESMQRARQKQKDGIEAMRTTLETLSRQFEQLREQQQRSTDAPRPSLGPSTLFVKLKATYGSLAETSLRLNAENFMIQRRLVEGDKVRLKLLDAIDTSDGPATTATPLHQELAVAFFDYLDISLEQAQDAINSCYRLIVQCEQAARPLAFWIMEGDGPCNTFGWTVSCEISTGNNFFLSMTKRLPGVSPQEAMERSWAVMSSGSKHSNRHSRLLVLSDVLQTFNDSMCIVGDEVHHPIKADAHMRSIAVRFRMVTERGFAVGMGSVNPRQPKAATRYAQSAVEYVDVFSWHDFTQDENGGGCVVSLKSLTQYYTDENLHLRLTNALCSTWRWESEVMKSPARLLVA